MTVFGNEFQTTRAEHCKFVKAFVKVVVVDVP